MFVFLLTSGAFTIDSSMPTLRRNLNEDPISLKQPKQVTKCLKNNDTTLYQTIQVHPQSTRKMFKKNCQLTLNNKSK
jgi:hypothetical protein